jgi:1-acyl-sn-glycerol-3-phosphate acyltransferase
MLRGTFGPIVRGIWIKEVTGMEHIPKEGPVIIAFNHQSYLDFLSFIAVSPRPIHFLSAEKFFSHIFWAPLMYLSGQIKVERKAHDKHALHELIHSHLSAGKVVGIFPEGTRAHSSTEMLHAFTGVAKYAVYSKVPVIPVGIKGAFEVMSRHDKKLKFKKTISIHVGPAIHFTEHHGKEHDEKTYRELTDKIMFEISRLSGKRYSHVGKMERDVKPAI